MPVYSSKTGQLYFDVNVVIQHLNQPVDYCALWHCSATGSWRVLYGVLYVSVGVDSGPYHFCHQFKTRTVDEFMEQHILCVNVCH